LKRSRVDGASPQPPLQIEPLMSIAVGSRLGPYEIVTLLGAGGMREVYRARDTKLNRDVALLKHRCGLLRVRSFDPRALLGEPRCHRAAFFSENMKVAGTFFKSCNDVLATLLRKLDRKLNDEVVLRRA